jgi:hypothetical protein
VVPPVVVSLFSWPAGVQVSVSLPWAPPVMLFVLPVLS